MNRKCGRLARYGAKLGATIFGFGLFTNSLALSHASLEVEKTKAGVAYEAIINLPHGCEGLPTDTILVKVPENMIVLLPPETDSWTVSATKAKLDKPAAVNGTAIEESIVQLKWNGGSIPASNIGQVRFGGQITDGLAPGTQLHFMVVQQCEDKAVRWIEILKEGQDMSDMQAPAPFLTIVDETEKANSDNPDKIGHSKHTAN